MWGELLKNMKRIIDSQEEILSLLVSHEAKIEALEKGREIEVDLPDTFVNN